VLTWTAAGAAIAVLVVAIARRAMIASTTRRNR